MPLNNLSVIYLPSLQPDSLLIKLRARKERESPFLHGSSADFSLGAGRSPKSGNQLESIKLKPLNVNIPSRELKPKK